MLPDEPLPTPELIPLEPEVPPIEPEELSLAPEVAMEPGRDVAIVPGWLISDEELPPEEPDIPLAPEPLLVPLELPLMPLLLPLPLCAKDEAAARANASAQLTDKI